MADFSMSVKCSVPGCAVLFLGDFVLSGDIDVSGIHPGDNSWHVLTVTKQIRTGLSGGGSLAWAYNFGIVAGIQFAVPVTAALVDNAMLVVGNYPEGVPFVPANPNADMRRCQRFYEVGDNFYRTYGAAGSVASMTQPYKVSKYSSPAVSTVFTPGLGGATGTVSVGAKPTEGIVTQMTNGGAPGEFSGVHAWTAEVP
jgi:hypothetical protein